VRAHAERIRSTRPTAVNRGWALDRMLARAGEAGDTDLVDALRDEATRILDEDRAMCQRIGELGAPFIEEGATILTHCNAGALATGGIGTALAPLYVAKRLGRRFRVIACETRPLWQGSRLTAWELAQADIPVTVIADNMAAALMRDGEIQACVTGADRIAANGDFANKTGTYALALAAHHLGVPLYVAAPSSSVDGSTASGAGIPIELRHRDELASVGEIKVVPDGVPVYNPAFDVTPAALVTALITERGIHRAPFDFSQAPSTSAPLHVSAS